MKAKKHTIIILIILFVNIFQNVYAKIELISYRSWNYCYKISNEDVEIIINPTYGGHILYYGLKSLNSNILWVDSTLNGYTLEKYQIGGRNKKAPDAGRFDIGNERLTETINDTTWVGPYNIRIINDYAIIVTSLPQIRSGIQLSREYSLEKEGSHLHINQTIKNISNHEVKYCHWSRTLSPSGGIYITQLIKTSKYPNGYALFEWNPDRIEINNPTKERLSFPNDTLFVAHPGGYSWRQVWYDDNFWLVLLY